MFTRRRLLAGALAAPLLPSLPIETLAHGLHEACVANLCRLFPNSLTAARALGAACGDGDGQSTAAALVDGLCREPGDRERLAAGSLDEIRAWLDIRIRDDFTAGRTRRVDGWVLSETEARLFTIVAAS